MSAAEWLLGLLQFPRATIELQYLTRKLTKRFAERTLTIVRITCVDWAAVVLLPPCSPVSVGGFFRSNY